MAHAQVAPVMVKKPSFILFSVALLVKSSYHNCQATCFIKLHRFNTYLFRKFMQGTVATEQVLM